METYRSERLRQIIFAEMRLAALKAAVEGFALEEVYHAAEYGIQEGFKDFDDAKAMKIPTNQIANALRIARRNCEDLQ